MLPADTPYIFQFHYGTIKSCNAGSIKKAKNYFNSTMVRLKDKAVQIGGENLLHFNSTMVRLKV